MWNLFCSWQSFLAPSCVGSWSSALEVDKSTEWKKICTLKDKAFWIIVNYKLHVLNLRVWKFCTFIIVLYSPVSVNKEKGAEVYLLTKPKVCNTEFWLFLRVISNGAEIRFMFGTNGISLWKCCFSVCVVLCDLNMYTAVLRKVVAQKHKSECKSYYG